MMQQWITAAIVAYAFWFVARRYLPKALRRRMRSWAVRGARRFGRHGLAAKLEARAEAGAACGDGCGSCGSCDSSAHPVEPKPFGVSVDALKRTLKRAG